MTVRTVRTERLGRGWVAVVGGLAVVALTVLGMGVVRVVSAPTAQEAHVQLLAFVVFLSLSLTSVASYFAWPSRWNVPAHTAVAFSIVAYLIPAFFLDTLADTDPSVVETYTGIVAAGALVTVVGVLLGARCHDLWRGRHERVGPTRSPLTDADIERRIRLVVGFCVVVLALCFATMGFIPAFADDPLAAKFFKGAYQAAYQPVAIPYRLSTTVLTTLLPILLVMVVSRRRSLDLALAACATALLLAGLLRDPAGSGALLALGVFMAWYRRPTSIYILVLTVVYGFGSALYAVLASLGWTSLGDSFGKTLPVAQQIAAGAPDIADQLHFLQAWLSAPTFTSGRTWFGGLIPGNYSWNPSVWTLSVLNPTRDNSQIVSGGLRLPSSIWGFVSFGTVGLVGVCLLSGIVLGFTSRAMAHHLPAATPLRSVTFLVIYIALTETLVVFYRLSYLACIALLTSLLVAGLLRRRSSAEPAQGVVTTSGAAP